jgi:3-oxoacyl-[acyl-carrier protein] reductase
MDLGLKGKVALVTAASKGLGKAAALQFAREGAKVALCARSEVVDRAADDIRRETGAQALAVRADVTQQADAERLIGAVAGHFGGLDILVTNAGGPPSGTFDTFDLDTWQKAVDLTLLSAVRLIKLALPHLRRSSAPAILTLTSISTKQPLDNLTLSNSIRMAVIGLTKTLSRELGPDKIRVNSILPGWTYTERVEELMKARAAKSGRTPGEEAALITAANPLKRMGRPDEFANVAVFLCSPAASYVNGVMLLVDGGSYPGTM